MPAPHHRVRKVLDGVDRLAVPADQHPEIRARARCGDQLVFLVELDPRGHADPLDDSRYQSTNLGDEVGLVRGALLYDRFGRDAGDDAGGGEADAQ